MSDLTPLHQAIWRGAEKRQPGSGDAAVAAWREAEEAREARTAAVLAAAGFPAGQRPVRSGHLNRSAKVQRYQEHARQLRDESETVDEPPALSHEERRKRADRELHELRQADVQRRAEERAHAQRTLDLRGIIERALLDADDPDPGKSVAAVMSRIGPFRRDEALEAALRVCCYIVADETAVGGSALPGLWEAP